MNARSLVVLCFLTFLVRGIIAALLPLGNDEAYYIMYARFPDFHYYDHPLLIGWAIKFSTWNFKFQHPFFYRLPAILLSIPTTVFVYKIASAIRNPKAGWVAACIFSASFYGSVIAGVFAMPDSIMVFFWTFSLLIATHIFISDKYRPEDKNELILWFGLVVGLAALAKIHAVFLWISFIGFAIFRKPECFKKYEFWVGLGITSLAFLPILLWNVQNDWVHFNFYASRVGTQSGFHPDLLLRELLGELGYQGPIVFSCILIFGFFKSGTSVKRNEKFFLLWMAFPLIFFILGLSLFRETLPHWSGPAYVSLIVLSSVTMVDILKVKKIGIWIWGSFSFMLIALILGMMLIFYYPGTIGSTKNTSNYGSGDFTLDMYGWEKSGNQIAAYIGNNHLTNLPMYSHQWFPAAHLDEYLTRKTGNTLYAVGSIEQIHQYKWINARRGGLPLSDSALFVVPTNYFRDPVQLYGGTFNSIQLLKKFPQYRGGRLTRYFNLYLMCQRKGHSF
jgi:hypothetical protein